MSEITGASRTRPRCFGLAYVCHEPDRRWVAVAQ